MSKSGKINLCVSGALGRMGQLVVNLAHNDHDIDQIEIFDVHSGRAGIDELGSLEYSMRRTDCILFIVHNNPDRVVSQATIATTYNRPVVIATTGMNESQLIDLNDLGQKNVVVQANNYCPGINALINLLPAVCDVFSEQEYDVEIVEYHHRRKLDAPSGTAMWLARTICDIRGYNYSAIECGRFGRSNGDRPHNIIGVQAVRGGSITGDHDIIFAGVDETITIHHHAQSPAVFARGMIKAIKFASQMKTDGRCGYFTAKDVFG